MDDDLARGARARLGSRAAMIAAALVTACAGTAPAPRDGSDATTESAPAFWVVDRVGDRSVLVLDPTIATSAREVVAADDWEQYARVEVDPAAPPVTAVRVLGEASCAAASGASSASST